MTSTMPELPTAFSSRPNTVAHLIAQFLHARGIKQIYGLTGGHIKPIWDELGFLGTRIFSSRHEAAAVHMAQAHADLRGELGVATVTTGPGLANAVTGIAAAFKARSPVLVLCGLPPTFQRGMKAFEDLPHVDILRPITRYAATIDRPEHVLWRLDEAVAAALGDDGIEGPAFLDIPIDVLRAEVPAALIDEHWFLPRRRDPVAPASSVLTAAVSLLENSKRPLVIAGRGAQGMGTLLADFLQVTQIPYLDTKESRGVLPHTHPAYIPALRSRAMSECDLVITIGRELDFELGYGSKAVFANNPKFLRIGRSGNEVSENRRGDVEIKGDISSTLNALKETHPRMPSLDGGWVQDLQLQNKARSEKLEAMCAACEPGEDGHMHPYRMLGIVNQYIDDKTVVVVDGGDIFSFARVALKTPKYMDAGTFGCVGVGMPYAVSAAINFPDRRVIAVVGDGAFGFNGFELETAVRYGAKLVVVVSNNSAFNIERIDQVQNFGGRVVGTEFSPCRYDLIAKGMGAYAERVEAVEDLPLALARAVQNAPALVDVVVTRHAVSPDFKSGLAELPDYQALRTWDNVEKKMRETS